MKQILKKRISSGILYLVLVIATFWTIFPMYLTFQASFATDKEIFVWPPRLWPLHPTLINYVHALTESRIPTYMANSLLVAGIAALSITLLSSLGGYALSRMRRYGTPIMFVFLTTQMFPAVLLVIPLYLIWYETGFIDTYLSLILTYTALFMPFCILLMRGFFAQVPVELEEAAMVDGCGRLGALLRVVLPIVLPGVGATLAFAFVAAWNEFIMALIFINSPEKMTLPVGLRMALGQYRIDWGGLTAIGTLALIPSVILFSYVQRYLVRGLTSGAVKG